MAENVKTQKARSNGKKDIHSIYDRNTAFRGWTVFLGALSFFIFCLWTHVPHPLRERTLLHLQAPIWACCAAQGPPIRLFPVLTSLMCTSLMSKRVSRLELQPQPNSKSSNFVPLPFCCDYSRSFDPSAAWLFMLLRKRETFSKTTLLCDSRSYSLRVFSGMLFQIKVPLRSLLLPYPVGSFPSAT